MKLAKKLIALLAMSVSASAFAEGIEWSGFGSFYYSQAFDNHFHQNAYSDNHASFTRDSLIGLNLSSKLDDNLAVVSQWVAAGDSAQATNFNLFVQWAYLSWKPADKVSLKIGRQLWPVLLASEYQRVKKLLPSAGIPNSAYSILPFISFDGVSMTKDFDLMGNTLALGAFYGSPKLNTTTANGNGFEFSNLKGVRATLDGSGWRWHATYQNLHARFMYATTFGATASERAKSDMNVYSTGFRFDKFNVYAVAEYTNVKGVDSTSLAALGGSKFIDKASSYYTLLGYRINKLLPYFAFSQGRTVYGVPNSTSPLGVYYKGKVSTYILGSNYQLNDAATLKIEFNQDQVPSPRGGYFAVNQTTTSTATKANSLKAGVDFIF